MPLLRAETVGPERAENCEHGRGEDDVCDSLPAGASIRLEIGNGHRLGGGYDTVADRILECLNAAIRP